MENNYVVILFSWDEESRQKTKIDEFLKCYTNLKHLFVLTLWQFFQRIILSVSDN